MAASGRRRTILYRVEISSSGWRAVLAKKPSNSALILSPTLDVELPTVLGRRHRRGDRNERTPGISHQLGRRARVVLAGAGAAASNDVPHRGPGKLHGGSRGQPHRAISARLARPRL